MHIVWRGIKRNFLIIITFMWYIQKKQKLQMLLLRNLHMKTEKNIM